LQISSATASPSLARRPVITTLAPALASASVVACPMPLVPPVTSADFPLKLNEALEVARA